MSEPELVLIPEMPEPDGKDVVIDPFVWVCSACGKRARSRYGFDRDGKSTAIDRGWDESCMLHAVLCIPNIERERDPKAPKWQAVKIVPGPEEAR